MIKLSYIKQLSDGKWRVYSRSGKNLGTYNSKSKAEKRLQQVEMFKHMKKDEEKKKRKKAFVSIIDSFNNVDETKTFSSVMRDINKDNPDDVKDNMRLFKETFDNALINDIDEPDKVALIKMLRRKKASDNTMFKFAQTIVEMGDPILAGKTIANVIKFLIRNLPESQRNNSLKTLRDRVISLSEYEISSKEVPPSAALGQSVAFIKNMLSGKNPNYVRNVLSNTVKFMY